MSDRQIHAESVNNLLYGVLASLYQVFGDSSAAVMRVAGEKMLESLVDQGVVLSNGNNHIEKIGERISELLKKANFCDDYTLQKVEDGIELKVKNCAFWGATQQLMAKGVPPFACPFANLTIAVVKNALKERAKVDSITPGATPGDSDIKIKFVR